MRLPIRSKPAEERQPDQSTALEEQRLSLAPVNTSPGKMHLSAGVAMIDTDMRAIDRLMCAAVAAGLARRSTALLETIGRSSGRPCVTPLTNGLDGDQFWIVTEHGHTANYVKNIKRNPEVRVKAGRSWRRGVATFVDEDPDQRLDKIASTNPRTKANIRIVRASGTQHIVIRVDLHSSV